MKKKHDIEDRIEEMKACIAKSTAENYAGIIMKHFKELSDENDEFFDNKMWNLKKKLCNQNTEVPMAIFDKSGNIVTGRNSLKFYNFLKAEI